MESLCAEGFCRGGAGEAARKARAMLAHGAKRPLSTVHPMRVRCRSERDKAPKGPFWALRFMSRSRAFPDDGDPDFAFPAVAIRHVPYQLRPVGMFIAGSRKPFPENAIPRLMDVGEGSGEHRPPARRDY